MSDEYQRLSEHQREHDRELLSTLNKIVDELQFLSRVILYRSMPTPQMSIEGKVAEVDHIEHELRKPF